MSLSRRDSLAGLLALAATPALAMAKPAKAVKPAASKAPGHWAEVEAQAKTMVTDKLVPGLAICARRHGATLFSKGFGLANIETATPVTPASVFHIGSITKQFTASAILQLAQEGKLSLDDTLAKYLPDFPNADRLVLRRMLSHTSGLGNYTQINPLVFLQDSRTDRNTAQLIEAMKPTSQKLAYEPGTAWRYSNTAYVLLGVILERIETQSYAEVMQRRLFTPLGLTHSAVDDAATVVPNRASGYSNAARGPSGFVNASFIAMSFPGGAGNLRSTAEDLCAWHGALLGSKVLQPASLKAMTTPATLNDGSLPSQPDGKSGKVETRYGFGVGLGAVDGHPSVSHDGGIQGFVSHLETLTDAEVTYSVLFNTDGGPFAPKALATAPGALNKAIRAAALSA
jgi:CubicO group peptidase (beta-lactamase class C family)